MPVGNLSRGRGRGALGGAPPRRRSARLKIARAVAGATLLWAPLGLVARGATDYWDGDGAGVVGGGPGQWDLSLNRWGASPSASVFGPFASGDTALFGGAGGTVDLLAALSANLDIQSGGYFFQGSSNTFTWPAAASVNVANGVSSEFRFPATGALSGLTKTGGGTFGFGASLVTNNAPININGGTLAYFRPGAAFNGFTGSNPVTIAAGATFNLGKALDVIGAISGGGTIVLGALNDSTSGVNGSNTSTVWGSTLNVNSDNSSSILPWLSAKASIRTPTFSSP